MSRASRREFVLLLPKHLELSVPPSVSGAGKVDIGDYSSRRELRTASLQLVLAQLGMALKQNAKKSRLSRQPMPHNAPQDSSRVAPLPTVKPDEAASRTQDGPHVAFSVPAHSGTSHPSNIIGEIKKGKGKLREAPRQFFLQEVSQTPTPDQQPCWWLDIASPTWDDMRALGKVCDLNHQSFPVVDGNPAQLLQLHPLTLEDILQKESREKFELFPRLGYYFIVFRAVERPQQDLALSEDEGCSSDDDGAEVTEVLDVANVYFVVFKEGICTFHFEDISIHMDSVRKKVLQLEGTMHMGSGKPLVCLGVI